MPGPVSSAADACTPFALSDLLLNANYLKDIGHWASSSTQYAACSVEPGTTEDVGKIVRTEHTCNRWASSDIALFPAANPGPDKHVLCRTFLSPGTHTRHVSIHPGLVTIQSPINQRLVHMHMLTHDRYRTGQGWRACVQPRLLIHRRCPDRNVSLQRSLLPSRIQHCRCRCRPHLGRRLRRTGAICRQRGRWPCLGRWCSGIYPRWR